MSDAHPGDIDNDVHTLVRLCGYSTERARAELTAFSHREKAGLIPAARALVVLSRTTPLSGDIESNRLRWREILRSSQHSDDLLAA